ncbi:hypothetical protein EJ08DRAFT_369714 [Tothia fuscella]|uniref:Uncharacterized protein n=1 Tax=Tothia fuscella TaxID=1048955 RepID=A0A9P4NM57_9PEZI|nr:hypothetical protein EJ08DRAFT_369714 [Tothia fuscella]
MPTFTPDSSCFRALNTSSESIPEWMGSFSLSASPNTDLWKLPSGDTSTCPILYTSMRHPFVSAEVLVSSDCWQMEWDQAGLVIFAGQPPGRTIPSSSSNPISDSTNTESASRDSSNLSPATSNPENPPPYTLPPPASKWVKVGLEYSNNACQASSVSATTDGADWTISALPLSQAHKQDLRIKFERMGNALWIYYQNSQGWQKIREVTMFFLGVEPKSVRVGVYVSRPANFAPSTTQSLLRVEFDELQIF